MQRNRASLLLTLALVLNSPTLLGITVPYQFIRGSKLLNVWVDGERPNLLYNGSDINVQLLGGTGATVKTSTTRRASLPSDPTSRWP